ncbi:hypothetical protein K7W42_12845 [Deinococcus sp. HMF7604]|uniref:hypothetical protein n=1 Tax=Deinococcus betulae TaxID=2873312 RepID=UPI001CCF139A|nr:hypothetical protein [Deinococcus betulae]MBZ9751745.1 hypothetical protein [Deinococcus betulae]
MPKAFTRGQTQILFQHTPESIFHHDDFGLCKVTSIDLDPLDSGSLNETALYDTIAEMAAQWPENFRMNFPDIRDPARRSRHFRLGAPRTVNFEPFPENVQCQQCGYVTDYETARRRGSHLGRCPRKGCDGTMKQLRYVQAHNCGRLETLYLPKGRKCKRCGGTEMRLYDPGRTPLARWVCLNPACATPLQGLFQTPCTCKYSEASLAAGRPDSDRKMRVYPVAEPGLYNPLIATFINLQQGHEQRLTQVEDAETLLLARTWGVLAEPVLDVAQKRAEWEGQAGSTADRIIEALRALDPNHPEVLRHDAEKANPPGHAAINTVHHHLGALTGGVPGRKLIEHVTLRDNVTLTTPEAVATQLRRRGQTAQADRFLKDALDIMTRLGIAHAEAVENFPIAQAAFGYTRVTKKPKASMLNPFPADRSSDDPRSPIFALPTETEALWFQLDPLRVARWMTDNRLIHGAVPTDAVAAWAWLWRGALKTPRRDDGTLHPASAALQTLIHTISHVMAQRMEWSGYAISSIGEYLLPESLSFVLYANRFTESKIGGLLTLFEQRLPLWLREAAQQGRDCIYDPLCARDGGTCAGCLHREFNCTHFNGLLSRATLYGGPLPDGQDFGTRTITHGYWQDALLTPEDES